MTMPNPDPKVIARSLTKAQRRYLTSDAEWTNPTAWAEKRWMTFPPANVHRVLIRLGLTDRSGQMLSLGLAVRQALIEMEKKDG